MHLHAICWVANWYAKCSCRRAGPDDRKGYDLINVKRWTLNEIYDALPSKARTCTSDGIAHFLHPIRKVGLLRRTVHLESSKNAIAIASQLKMVSLGMRTVSNNRIRRSCIDRVQRWKSWWRWHACNRNSWRWNAWWKQWRVRRKLRVCGDWKLSLRYALLKLLIHRAW